MAPAHQLRLSLTGSEDGEAETETCRVAKPLWRKTNRPSGPSGLNLTEPPGADPHAGWCGRGEWATTPPMPIILEVLGELPVKELAATMARPFAFPLWWIALGTCSDGRRSTRNEGCPRVGFFSNARESFWGFRISRPTR